MITKLKKINIITLGCSKNTVDSEQLASKLTNCGFKVTHNSETTNFDIAMVNTCGFINAAKEESINTILELVELKKLKKIEKIIIFGCLAQRYKEELKTEIPEVDMLFGNFNLDELLKYLGASKITDEKYNRNFDSYGHYAYLKIAEGCNRNCSFCAIPLIKGKYQSRNFHDIIDEAKYLAKKGVKELLLIAQDLNYYGYDIDKKFLLPELVLQLSEIQGVEWIRLHYLYPFLFPKKLIEVIANNPKVCKYIDIPLQHVSDKVLKSMNRRGTKQQILELLNNFREKIPELAIRTTMLIGHPQETEEDFNELIEFIKEQKFDRLGVFTYSEEEGTKSATKYKDSIPQEIKEQRAEKIMSIQQDISFEKNQTKVNKIFKVLIDRKENNNYIGRTEYDSVEVDNEVLISSENKLKTGNFYDVLITEAFDYDLTGKII